MAGEQRAGFESNRARSGGGPTSAGSSSPTPGDRCSSGRSRTTPLTTFRPRTCGPTSPDWADRALAESRRGRGVRRQDGHVGSGGRRRRYPEPQSEDLRHLVRLEWAAMDEWFEEDQPVYTHPRDPYTRVAFWRARGTCG